MIATIPADMTPTAVLALAGPWTIGVKEGRRIVRRQTWHSTTNARRAFDELLSLKPGFTRFITIATPAKKGLL